MKPPIILIAFCLWLLLANVFPVLSQRATFNKVLSPIGNFSTIVGGIAQDKNGYMWFASAGGLYRYDGYQFKLYSHDPADSNTISTQRLETVYADSKGIIWIATWINGIDRLDPVTGEFTHYAHDPSDPASLSSDSVKCFLEDRDGNLWIGTNAGIDKFDPVTGKFQNYHHDPNDPNSLSCNHTRRIYEDKQGTIWVATGTVWGEGCKQDEGGLNRFDKKTGRFVQYLHDPKNPRSLINNKIQGIYEDSGGTFWIGSADDGLHTMDRETGTFERHQYDPAHPEKLSRPALRMGTFTDQITFITEDASGGIWIGTLANGVSHYDPKSQKTTHYVNENANDGFTANGGWSYCNSRDGVLWIGTFQGSLFRIDPFQKKIPYVSMGSSTNAFCEDIQDNMWIGTSEGLVFQNKKTGTSKKFRYESSNPSSISSDVIISLFRDQAGTLWIGTLNGLNRFNAQSNTFTRYQNNPNDPKSIIDGQINALEDGGVDSLWIGGTNGLDLLNKRTGKFIHLSGTSNGEPPRDIIALLRDKSGILWIGSYFAGGLYNYNFKTATFNHFLKGRFVVSLFEDSHNKLWVGIEAEGVYWINNSGKDFAKFTDSRTGIESTGIYAIQEDDQHNLWLSSASGIFKINPQTNQSTAFGVNEGVNVGGMSPLAGYRSKQGEIYFGDATGYYIISSDQLIGNPNPPQIVLTDFRIGGKSLLTGKGTLLNLARDGATNLSLKYEQNTISISFAGIHYGNPEYNRHQYMLENYDQDWREAGIEKTAEYFNVPPGNYLFKVKAASSAGVWAESAIRITITPPWWRTWWAYGTYGLLLVAGIYGVDRVQRQAVIRSEREKARVRELEQAKEIEKAYHELRSTQTQLIQSEKMASLGELTAGIAHEIQNPLNFVNNFSEVNSELISEMKEELDKGNITEAKTIAESIDENEKKIIFHGKRADGIVKGMLQHSRSSSGVKEPTHINALADEYLRLAYHGLRAKDKSFNAIMKTDFDESIDQLNVVPQDMGRVILNLITNAFYAVTDKKNNPASSASYEPTVTVSTKRAGNQVLIKVRDNGNGIPPGVLDKIFQPFFTTKPTGQGTGLGLSMSYDIVTKSHNGELKVETKVGEGSEFVIVLPA